MGNLQSAATGLNAAVTAVNTRKIREEAARQTQLLEQMAAQQYAAQQYAAQQYAAQQVQTAAYNRGWTDAWQRAQHVLAAAGLRFTPDFSGVVSQNQPAM